MDVQKLDFIIHKFFINTKVLHINRINSGLINKTYIVEHFYDGKKSKFILQSLSNIFESAEVVNFNHKLITDHINKKIKKNSYLNINFKKWETPSLIRCKSNNLFSYPFDSEFWRAMEYIDNAFNFNNLEDEQMSYQTGVGLAKFHLICSDLNFSKLKINIKNFHDTKYYINKYNSAIKAYNFSKLDYEIRERIKLLISSLCNHTRFVDLLLKSLKKKSIDKHVIHGDPKLSNFLFDFKYKYVVSLIDLDTVSSGYLLTDLADCIRSICNLAGEDPESKDHVRFDLGSCKYFLKGYFSISDRNLSFQLIPEFIYLIIFELTIRFLTDFLKANRYFNIEYETHNLFRAEVQYQLLSSFLNQIPNFSNDLSELGISASSTFISDVQKFV